MLDREQDIPGPNAHQPQVIGCSEGVYRLYTSKTSCTPSAISSPSVSRLSASSISRLHRSCPSSMTLSAARSFSNNVDNVAADRPEAKGRMFSFCDSIRAKSVVGAAVEGEVDGIAGIGEKNDSILSVGDVGGN